MPEPMTRTDYRCPNCGSHDVRAEGSARWSVARQSWELEDVNYIAICSHCGDEYPLHVCEIEIDDEGKPT